MPRLYSDFWGLLGVTTAGSVFLAVAYGFVHLFLYWGWQGEYAAIAGVLISLPLVAFVAAGIDEVHCRRELRKRREWWAERDRKAKEEKERLLKELENV